jgi:hypothetical protein
MMHGSTALRNKRVIRNQSIDYIFQKTSQAGVEIV